MYHWDLPAVLFPTADLSQRAFVDVFGEYVVLLLDRFGNYSDHWCTFNEPRSQCKGASHYT